MKKRGNQRREFFKNALAFGAAVAFAPQLLQAIPLKEHSTSKDSAGTTFLFQGDSITDGNRTRDNDRNHVMGLGYQYIIASKLGYDFPEKGFRFFNRGISGNKVTYLPARWQQDTLELKPDGLSILIGINDTSALVYGNKDVTAEQYESGYRALLKQTKQALLNVQLILCEPFVLAVGNVKQKWEAYSGEVEKRQKAVRRLSEEFNAVFVPFQAAFDEALQKAPGEYWIWDGIHPMPAGHQLMAREWMQHVQRKLNFFK